MRSKLPDAIQWSRDPDDPVALDGGILLAREDIGNGRLAHSMCENIGNGRLAMEISCLDLPLPVDCDNTIDDMGEMGLE